MTDLIQFHTKMALHHKARGEATDKIWCFLEESETSPAAQKYAHAICVLILTSVLLSILQAGDGPLQGPVSLYMEMFVDLIFATECAVRFAVSPHKAAFFHSLFNVIDIHSFVTLALRIWIMLPQWGAAVPVEPWMSTFLDCMVPLVRLLKLLRHFEQFQLLLRAFELAFEALPVLLYTGSLILLTASFLIYICEPRSNMESFSRTMYFTIVTMTTVGYGDYSPETTLGTLVTSVLLVSSALYMAIPLGIVGSAFNKVWEDRDRLLLMHRLRKRLEQWGYTPADIATFFTLFSSQDDCTLNYQDFESMIEEMKLGLPSKRIHEIFLFFDADDSGIIEPEEFVAILFPKAEMEKLGPVRQASDNALLLRGHSMLSMESKLSMLASEKIAELRKTNSKGTLSSSLETRGADEVEL